MNLSDVEQWFAGHGLPFAWQREVGGAPRILRPPAGSEIGLGPLEVGIVVPDVHLGWNNDVFRYNDPHREATLERFLDTLTLLRDDVGPDRFRAIQLGDWFDFWRSPGLNAPTALAIILSQYPGVVGRSIALGLRHCVGNHDAALVRPANRAPGMYVEIVQTMGVNSVVCFHGHDTRSLELLHVDALAETIGLNVLNVLNSEPLLGRFGSWIQRFFDDSFVDPWVADSASLPWPPAQVPGPDGWSAPWVARGDAVNVGGAVRGLEHSFNQRVRLVFVGHSHRPGISWCPIASRRVALIDVGSWTYGRTEFAVVCPDGVGLAHL